MKSLFNYLIPLLILMFACGAIQQEELALAQKTTAVNQASAPEDLKPQDELAPFLLKGYEILDAQKGDINNDQLADVILIQKGIDEAETFDVAAADSKPRPLMLLLRQPNGKLELAARNDHLVLCIECGGMMGDPYQSIAIKNGYFSIEHFGGSAWRWSRIITFKYHSDQQNWYLHKDGGVSFHAANPDSTTEESVKTVKDFGVIKFEDYKSDDAQSQG